MNVCRILRAAVLALLVTVAPAQAQQNDEQVQGRYRLCMDKADADSLEEFRSDCDVLCIHQKLSTAGTCLDQHMKWNTATCPLPTAEQDREERHLEQSKDRCLKEFKAGVTAHPDGGA